MTKKEFETGHGNILGTLRAARGPCPPADELLDWLEGALNSQRAEAIGQHLTLCSHCADTIERAKQPDPQVDDLSWQRTARRLDARRAIWKAAAPRQRPGWLAVGAAAVAAVAVILVNLPNEGALPPPNISETRDADIILLEPRGPVRSVEAFHWQGIPAPVLYRIEVNAVDAPTGSSEPLWTRVTTETRLRVDATLLAALADRQALQWRVVVLDDEGHVLGRSEWVAFEPAP
jgi:hypothetical protein